MSLSQDITRTNHLTGPGPTYFLHQDIHATGFDCGVDFESRIETARAAAEADWKLRGVIMRRAFIKATRPMPTWPFSNSDIMARIDQAVTDIGLYYDQNGALDSFYNETIGDRTASGRTHILNNGVLTGTNIDFGWNQFFDPLWSGMYVRFNGFTSLTVFGSYTKWRWLGPETPLLILRAPVSINGNTLTIEVPGVMNLPADRIIRSGELRYQTPAMQYVLPSPFYPNNPVNFIGLHDWPVFGLTEQQYFDAYQF